MKSVERLSLTLMGVCSRLTIAAPHPRPLFSTSVAKPLDYPPIKFNWDYCILLFSSLPVLKFMQQAAIISPFLLPILAKSPLSLHPWVSFWSALHHNHTLQSHLQDCASFPAPAVSLMYLNISLLFASTKWLHAFLLLLPTPQITVTIQWAPVLQSMDAQATSKHSCVVHGIRHIQLFSELQGNSAEGFLDP